MGNSFPPFKPNRDFLAYFRKILRNNNYTYDNLLTNNINLFTWDRYDLPVLGHKIPPVSRFGLFFHLFFLGRDIQLRQLLKLLKRNDIDELIKMNILEKKGKVIRSLVFLKPYKSYFFASDFGEQSVYRIPAKMKPANFVYPPGLDSITLIESSMHKKVGSVLDVGCGCGIGAIVSSTYADKVTGVDINPRAVNFSRFNAKLNGIENCTFLCGDLYKPVSDKKFDLILANPPYELSLSQKYQYRDGGRFGYSILKRVIEGAPAHLSKNGLCQIISKIGEFSDDTKEQLFRKWLREKRVHVYFLGLYHMDLYATTYYMCMDILYRQSNTIEFKKYWQAMDEVLAYLEKEDFKKIDFGLVTITGSRGFYFKEEFIDGNKIEPNELSKKIYDLVNLRFNYLPFYGKSHPIRQQLNRIFYGFRRWRSN